MAELTWTTARVAAATGATGCRADLPLTGVVTDSRQVTTGALFVALRGESFDGHAFVEQAWAAGAAAVLVERPVTPPAGRVALQVGDTLLAYGALGRWWRQQHQPLVVAVTGSTGKSSCKQLIAAVLQQQYVTLSSPGSFNNEVGLPATLLRLTPEHQAVVLELAMRGEGQIRYLAELCEPRIGALSNIGTSHIGLLGSREAIARAKGELLDHLGPRGVAVLNAEDPFQPALAARHSGRTLWYGRGRTADVRAQEIELRGLAGSRFRLVTPKGTATVELSLPGQHMVTNALAAAAVGHAAGLAPAAIAAGLAAVEAMPLRLQVVQLRNGARVINDSYNAAPDSVRAALQVLASEPTVGRRIVCLADMLELGDLAQAEHLRLGQAVAEVADVVLGVGELGGLVAAGARDAGLAAAEEVADPKAAGRRLAELCQPGDLVLLKGSRAVGLERALAELELAE